MSAQKFSENSTFTQRNSTEDVTLMTNFLKTNS